MLRTSLAAALLINFTSIAEAQRFAPEQSEAEVRACLDGGDDECLVDMMAAYAAEGFVEAEFMGDLLRGRPVGMMLLRRCRPFSERDLGRLHALAEVGERSPFANDLETSPAFDRALNDWLSNPQEPFRSVGTPSEFGLEPGMFGEELPTQAIAELLQIIHVERACGDSNLSDQAIDQVFLMVEPALETLNTFERVLALTLLLAVTPDGHRENELTQELTALIPQFDDASFGQTISVIGLVIDHELDMFDLAARWENPLFRAFAAQAALERREPESDGGG
ncbi:MAG: hypothetical protein AAF414_24010 [Pseudomonadota bacterium]